MKRLLLTIAAAAMSIGFVASAHAGQQYVYYEYDSSAWAEAQNQYTAENSRVRSVTEIIDWQGAGHNYLNEAGYIVSPYRIWHKLDRVHDEDRVITTHGFQFARIHTHGSDGYIDVDVRNGNIVGQGGNHSDIRSTSLVERVQTPSTGNGWGRITTGAFSRN